MQFKSYKGLFRGLGPDTESTRMSREPDTVEASKESEKAPLRSTALLHMGPLRVYQYLVASGSCPGPPCQCSEALSTSVQALATHWSIHKSTRSAESEFMNTPNRYYFEPDNGSTCG